MRAAGLLGLPVHDGRGAAWGVVADVLVDVPRAVDPRRVGATGRPSEGDGTVDRWPVAGVVVAPTEASAWWHGTGLVWSRRSGPWPLSAFGRRTARRSCFVPAEAVTSWNREALQADPADGVRIEEALQ
jgi:hypothetical protein